MSTGVLVFLSGICLLEGVVVFFTAISAIHQILGAVSILSAAVLFAGAVINSSLTKLLELARGAENK